MRKDNRAVLPLGSTEQHAYLSLSVDSILSERVAAEAARAARHTGISGHCLWAHPLFHGISRFDHSSDRDLSSLVRGHPRRPERSGFPAHPARQRPWRQSAGCCILRSNGWPTTPTRRSSFIIGGQRPLPWTRSRNLDQVASHASWMENFPWTRLADVRLPDEQKPDD